MAIAGCQGSQVVKSTRSFPQKTGFIERKILVDGTVRAVWVFLPPDYTPNRLYPAILFLHGLFENGNGGTTVLNAGFAPVIAKNPKRWPFITIFPQSTGSWKGDDRERLAMAALKDAQHEYMIDPDRVILAGFSFGGLGVWEIGAKNRERFAALVTASAPSAIADVDQVAKMPIWAFASQDDPVVNATNSVEMCDAIQARGGHARLTRFPGNEHDCCLQAIDESDLIHWMLAQARNPMLPTAGAAMQASGKLRMWETP